MNIGLISFRIDWLYKVGWGSYRMCLQLMIRILFITWAFGLSLKQGSKKVIFECSTPASVNQYNDPLRNSKGMNVWVDFFILLLCVVFV